MTKLVTIAGVTIIILIIVRLTSLPKETGSDIDETETAETETTRYMGFVPSEEEYPPQPVKIAEIADITPGQIGGRKAYPFCMVWEALGYTVSWDGHTAALTNGEDTFAADTSELSSFITIDGVVYAADSYFYDSAKLNFRYIESINTLEIFR